MNKIFALAIAIGLTPQILPAIISVHPAHGTRLLAQQRVIVRRLAAIEDLGGRDVLGSHKTGTLIEGRFRLHAAVEIEGRPRAPRAHARAACASLAAR